MADTKLSAFTSHITTFDGDERLYVVDTPSGTPASKYAEVNDLRAEYVRSGNLLINGGFDIAQRQTPATLTTITDNKCGPDRWRVTRANADVQYQRADALGETGLTSKYFGTWKKITNTGKIFVCQIVEGVNSAPMRSKKLIWQVKMKASTNTTVRMGVFELQTAGTIDTIPASIVAAFGADGADPTMGANIAILGSAVSKSVTTSWQNFSIQATAGSASKNLIAAVWTNAGIAANVTLSMAEAILAVDTVNGQVAPWIPRPFEQEVALCQRYYEKSYDIDSVDYTSLTGAWAFTARVADQQDRIATRFVTTKFAIPTMTLIAYSSGTAANIRNITTTANLAAATVCVGMSSFVTYPTANTTANSLYAYHWTAEIEL